MERQAGLTSAQAAERRAAGLGNDCAAPETKSVKAIVLGHLITPFTILNAVLAALVIAAGSWKNTLFMGVILCNVVIGVVQELRSKAAIDRLTLIAAPRARVLRDGAAAELPLEELVLDDVLELRAGDQVGADCVILEGWCQMDESLLTGEAEPVSRGAGEELLSGSFLVAGRCLAQVVRVGAERYAARITAGAKYLKHTRSEIMDCVGAIIRTVGFLLIPVGTALFVKQCFFTSYTPRQAVVATVAALVGMIPEGLVLLTSMVLAVSVVRLAGKGALARELHCVEMLARVDVLCLDKTGTLTTGTLEVARCLAAPGFSEERLRAGLAALLKATEDQNPTARALRDYAGEPPAWGVTKAAPFRSDRRWSGGSFETGESWVLGAAERLFPGGLGELAPAAEEAVSQGLRVVALAVGRGDLDGGLPGDLKLAGLLILSDTLRPSAAETLGYFRAQGVELKVISGDDPRTAAKLAGRAGLPGAERWVDAANLDGEAATKAAAEAYTVFGRVTPQQKLWLVQALKERGHTVAMTGDGVNDVLALRESDCAVAMAAGSEAARNVSQIVLTNSDFSALPAIVGEGRRAIHNLQRSAALFLTKTCFATLLAVCFLFLNVGYPFQPIQLTLISALTIGAPSFLLALEPNFQSVRGRFRDNVFARAIPGGVAMATDVLWCVALGRWLPMSALELSTLCVLLVGFAVLVNLWCVAWPLNLRRGCLVAARAVGFFLGSWLLRDFFSLALPPAGWMWPVLGALCAWTLAVQLGLRLVFRAIRRRRENKKGVTPNG